MPFIGASLSAFLQATPTWASEPALAEMAALDWALTLAFDAPDADPVPVAVFRELDPAHWPGLKLKFHPSLHLIDLHTNVNELRRAVDRGEALVETVQRDTATPLAVWRKGFEVLHRSLEVDEAAAFNEFRDDSTFADVCGLLCDYRPTAEVPPRAAVLIARWANDDWIAGTATQATLT